MEAHRQIEFDKFCNTYRIPKKKSKDNYWSRDEDSEASSGNWSQISKNAATDTAKSYTVANNYQDRHPNGNNATESQTSCLVCGEDTRTNIYYRGLSLCKACYMFYHLRQVGKVKITTLGCVNGDDSCIIDVRSRNDCGHCRMEKLYAAGLQRIDQDSHDNPRPFGDPIHRQGDRNDRQTVDKLAKKTKDLESDEPRQRQGKQADCRVCGTNGVLVTFRGLSTCKYCKQFSINHKNPESTLLNDCVRGQNDCLLLGGTRLKDCEYCLVVRCIQVGTIQQSSTASRMTGPFMDRIVAESTSDASSTPTGPAFSAPSAQSETPLEDDDIFLEPITPENSDDDEFEYEQRRPTFRSSLADKSCQLCGSRFVNSQVSGLFLCGPCYSFHHWGIILQRPFTRNCLTGTNECTITESNRKCGLCRLKKLRSLMSAVRCQDADISKMNKVVDLQKDNIQKISNNAEADLENSTDTDLACNSCGGNHARYHRAFSKGSRVILVRCHSRHSRDGSTSDESQASRDLIGSPESAKTCTFPGEVVLWTPGQANHIATSELEVPSADRSTRYDETINTQTKIFEESSDSSGEEDEGISATFAKPLQINASNSSPAEFSTVSRDYFELRVDVLPTTDLNSEMGLRLCSRDENILRPDEEIVAPERTISSHSYEVSRRKDESSLSICFKTQLTVIDCRALLTKIKGAPVTRTASVITKIPRASTDVCIIDCD